MGEDSSDVVARLIEKIAHLEVALRSARRIGIAVGVIAERNGVTPEEAFGMLVAASQGSHRKVRHVADDVVRALSTRAGNGGRPL